jgi:hypothetical protein
MFMDKWQGFTQGGPRSAPPQGMHKLTHQACVYPLDHCFDPFSRDDAPLHTKLRVPFDVGSNVAQLRVGSAHLELEQGRYVCPEVTVCVVETMLHYPLPGHTSQTGTSRNVEDLKHLVLDCPV